MRVALEQLTSDLSRISNWGRENMVVFNASKTQFLHLYTRHNLPHNYDIFFDNTQLKPSSVLNILGVSLVIFLRSFFTPPQLHALHAHPFSVQLSDTRLN